MGLHVVMQDNDDLVHDEVEYCTGFHASVVPFHFLGSNIFIARLKFSTCYGMCLNWVELKTL
jgi:hypothetical protein